MNGRGFDARMPRGHLGKAFDDFFSSPFTRMGSYDNDGGGFNVGYQMNTSGYSVDDGSGNFGMDRGRGFVGAGGFGGGGDFEDRMLPSRGFGGDFGGSGGRGGRGVSGVVVRGLSAQRGGSGRGGSRGVATRGASRGGGSSMGGTRGKGGVPAKPAVKEVKKEYWCQSCAVCCTSPELLLQHMNGKKHTAKVVKLAEAVKSSKIEAKAQAKQLGSAKQPQEQSQQQQQPKPQQSGKKRKAESAEPAKPAMIGIQDLEYWCFPCSVSARNFETLQKHLDGKRHVAKLRVLGGPEAFLPPQPLGPLPVTPSPDGAPSKRQKKDKKDGSIPPPPVVIRISDKETTPDVVVLDDEEEKSPSDAETTTPVAAPIAQTSPVATPPPAKKPAVKPLIPPAPVIVRDPQPMTGIQDNAYCCFPCKVSCNRIEQLEIHLGGKKHAQKINFFGGAHLFQPHKELPALEIPVSANKQNRMGLAIGPLRTFEEDDIPIPTIQIRPAYWCNICNMAMASESYLRKHITTKRHAATYEAYGEMRSKFLPIDGILGATHGRDQAQIGMKDHSLYCFLCEESIRSGKVEAHLRDSKHEARIADGEAEAEEQMRKEEEAAIAKAAENTKEGGADESAAASVRADASTAINGAADDSATTTVEADASAAAIIDDSCEQEGEEETEDSQKENATENGGEEFSNGN